MKSKLLVVIALFFMVFIAGFLYLNYFERSTSIPQDDQEQTSGDIEIPQDWESYENSVLGVMVSYPTGFSVSENGDNSILVIKDVSEQGAGPANFVYVTVVQKGSDYEVGEAYNYNKAHTDFLMSMKVGDNQTLPGENEELSEWTQFERHPDTLISGMKAKTYTNLKPWEFPSGTKEYRYIIDGDRKLYILGGYITTGETHAYSFDEDLFNKIISLVQLSDESSEDLLPSEGM